MKLIKRLSVYIVALCLAIVTVVPLHAATTLTPDVDRKGSIALHFRDQGERVSDGTIIVYKVADGVIGPDGYQLRYTEDFQNCGYTLNNINSWVLPDRLSNYVTENAIVGTTVEVNSNGDAYIGDLDVGLYLIMQGTASTGYEPIRPFLVTVPISDGDTLLYDVNATPKMQLTPEEGTTGERPTTEGTTGDRPSTEGTTQDQPSTEGTTQDQPSTEGTTQDQPSTEGTTQDQPSTEGTTQDQPSTEGTTQDQPSTEGTTQDQPSTEGTTQDQPSTEVTQDEPPTSEEEPTTTTEDPEHGEDAPPGEDDTTGENDDEDTEDSPPEGHDDHTRHPGGGDDHSRLPQTGQLWWPVPCMAFAGIFFTVLGWRSRKEYGDEEE